MPTGANTEPLGQRKRPEVSMESILAAAAAAAAIAKDLSPIDRPKDPRTIIKDPRTIDKDPKTIIKDPKIMDRDPKTMDPKRSDSREPRRDRHNRRSRSREERSHRSSGRSDRRKRSRSRDRHERSSNRSRSKDRDRRHRYSTDRDDVHPDTPVFGPVLPPVAVVNVGYSGSMGMEYSDPNTPGTPNSEGSGDGKRKRKSRWSKETEKAFVPGMPTMIPANLTDDQRSAYLLQLQIEDVTRKLRTSDYGIPPNPEDRSPSPEPVYDTHGKRLNTREVRTRQKLELSRHTLITDMLRLNPHYKPPPDYKAPQSKLHGKVWIPQDDNPEINFVGLLIGPRGNTLKQLEKETGSRIIIRGKGSVKEGKIAKRDGPLPGEDEPLHAYITATDQEAIDRAITKIHEMIDQALEIPDQQNELRKVQLRQLALLNGTLRGDELALAGGRCSNCGATTHKSWECPDRPNVTANIYCSACGSAGHIAKDCKNPRPGGVGGVPGSALDDEYSALMAELGQGDGERVNTKPIVRINLAKPRPPPLVGTGSTPIPPPWMGPPMPPWGWMPPPGMPMPPMPPMPPGMGGMMPPPPPPPPGDRQGNDSSYYDNDNGNSQIPPPPVPPDFNQSSNSMSMPMPPMMMGWPPMMPPGYPGPVPPPPPAPPSNSNTSDGNSNSNDMSNYFADLFNAAPPPPPPPS